MYQIANLYELLGDMGQAVEWYFQVIGLVPTDPAILQKMATIYDNDGDKQQAYQYYFDSYRYLDLFDTIQALAKKNVDLCKLSALPAAWQTDQPMHSQAAKTENLQSELTQLSSPSFA